MRRRLAQMQGADRFEGFGHAALDFVGGESHVRRSEGDVLLRRGHEELVVRVLEDHAHRLPHQPQRFGRDGNPARRHPTACGREQSVGVQQQGRLAGAVGTDGATFSPWAIRSDMPLSAS